MTKRIAIIGRGTAGMLAAVGLSSIQDGTEVEWYFDPTIPTQAVGEGSVLSMPRTLFLGAGFTYADLKRVNGSVKTGLFKSGWGSNGEDFFHGFPPPHVSMHFNAVELQNYMLDKLQQKIKVTAQNVTADSLDATYVMDCSGRPKNFDLFDKSEFMCVNAVHVVQCPWEHPEFDYTLTLARPHGWVFGIPLQNRCSIGYLYNDAISTLEEIQADIKNVIDEYKLTPSGGTNNLSFNSYARKVNYTGRVAYNGNASFFLEPLEATSVGVMNAINNNAYNVWYGGGYAETANNNYKTLLKQIETLIMMHYYAGSKYESPFWEYAKERGARCIERAIKTDPAFVYKCTRGLSVSNVNQCAFGEEYGVWWEGSFYENIKGLGIASALRQLISQGVDNAS